MEERLKDRSRDLGSSGVVFRPEPLPGPLPDDLEKTGVQGLSWHELAQLPDDGLGLALQPVHLEALVVETVDRILEAPVVCYLRERCLQVRPAGLEVRQELGFQWACRLRLTLRRLRVRSPVRFFFELLASLMLEGEQAAAWRHGVVADAPVVAEPLRERDEPAAAATAVGTRILLPGALSPRLEVRGKPLDDQVERFVTRVAHRYSPPSGTARIQVPRRPEARRAGPRARPHRMAQARGQEEAGVGSEAGDSRYCGSKPRTVNLEPANRCRRLLRRRLTGAAVQGAAVNQPRTSNLEPANRLSSGVRWWSGRSDRVRRGTG